MSKKITTISFALLISCTVFLMSCNESDPLPISKASFGIQNENQLERGVAVNFINLSINSASYVWDYGDGSKDSLVAAPSHVYDESGTYDVTLTAYTEDGQKSSETKAVKIKKRLLVGFTIANISFVNYTSETEFQPWDDDDTGPDLVFVFGAQGDETLDNYIFTDPVMDVKPEDFPINYNLPESLIMELNSEPYDLVILDDDPEKEGQEGVNPYDVMFGIAIDPVKYLFSVKDDQDQGLIQVSIEGFAIDMYVNFALQ